VVSRKLGYAPLCTSGVLIYEEQQGWFAASRRSCSFVLCVDSRWKSRERWDGSRASVSSKLAPVRLAHVVGDLPEGIVFGGVA